MADTKEWPGGGYKKGEEVYKRPRWILVRHKNTQ